MSGAVGRIKGQRRPLDAYYTPDSLAKGLVGLLPIERGDRALEPNAGGGAFVRALNAAGAVVTANDLNKDAKGLKQAKRSRVGDFLTSSWQDDRPLWVVGNPPYKEAQRQILHALRESDRHVAMLLRLGFLAGKERASMVWSRGDLRHVWVLSQRPSFTGGGTDASEYGFFWWDKAHTGSATVSWFQARNERQMILGGKKRSILG